MTNDSTRKSAPRHEWRIFPAVVVIAVGALFLAGNLGYRLDFLYHGNWWAWIILLAALAPLTRAYELVRARGKFDADALRHVTSAAFIVLVAVMFLLNLDWQIWWPLFVIVGGVAMLAGRSCGYRYGRRDRDPQPGSDADATFKR